VVSRTARRLTGSGSAAAKDVFRGPFSKDW
jgi:hypothetical protein